MPSVQPINSQEIFTWDSFLELTEELVGQGKTTGPNQSEKLAYYTGLNLRRMKRVYKTTKLIPEVVEAVKRIQKPQTWLVITEAWCGDAAQIIPILARMADLNPLIDLRLILRDENLDIMDRYLTGTARAIPKLIIFDTQQHTELGVWGPRPTAAQDLVMDAKNQSDYPMEQLLEDLQLWYTRDKTLSTQHEVASFLHQV